MTGSRDRRATKTGPTPLPMRQIIPIMAIQMINAFGMNAALPISPFMAQDFFSDLDPGQVGYYSGYIVAAYFLGQLFGCPIWGALSDHFGRRPMVLAGTAGACSCVVLFSFSLNLYHAVAARFFWGLLNGNIVVVKTSLSEVCDDSNMAKGMTVVTTCLGVGQMLGPAISGFLANPAQKWALFRGVWLFTKFPYFLSCLPAVMLSAVGLVLAALYFQETHPDLQPKYQELTEITDVAPGPQVEASTGPSPGPSPPPQGRLCLLFRSIPAICLVPVSAYALLGFVQIGFAAVFPLLLVNAPGPHGFGYGTSAVGLLMAVSGPTQILCSLFGFPWLAPKVGYRRVIAAFATSWGIVVALVPFTTLLPVSPTWPRFTALAILFLLQGMMMVMCYTAVFILINNSAPRTVRGRVNGLGQSGASLARIFSPTACSSIFAATQSATLPFPFDFHCAFLLVALLAAALGAGSAGLPARLERKPEAQPPLAPSTPPPQIEGEAEGPEMEERVVTSR